jgi:aryl-alcohol dehydrogenase-like predicted oxidoreductase
VTLLDTADVYGTFTNEMLVGKAISGRRGDDLAGARGCTAGQLALAWVLAQGSDIVPIPGTKRVRYLEENTAASEFVLSAEDLATIEAAIPADAVMGDRYATMSSIGR